MSTVPRLRDPALRYSKAFKKKIKFCQKQKCKEKVEMTYWSHLLKCGRELQTWEGKGAGKGVDKRNTTEQGGVGVRGEQEAGLHHWAALPVLLGVGWVYSLSNWQGDAASSTNRVINL